MDLTNYFTRQTREDHTTYVVLTTPPAMEWLRDAVMAAHDDEMPNDWRFETCWAILDELEDGAEPGEIADSLVDVYTANLLAWLADNLNRVGYCDEAWQDDLASASDQGIVGLIRAGQYLAIERMAHVLAEAIDKNG